MIKQIGIKNNIKIPYFQKLASISIRSLFGIVTSSNIVYLKTQIINNTLPTAYCLENVPCTWRLFFGSYTSFHCNVLNENRISLFPNRNFQVQKHWINWHINFSYRFYCVRRILLKCWVSVLHPVIEITGHHKCTWERVPGGFVHTPSLEFGLLPRPQFQNFRRSTKNVIYHIRDTA